MIHTYFFHFGSISIIVAITSLGVGIGESLAGLVALKAIDEQPNAYPEIKRISMLGMALIETAGILGLVISLMLLKDGFYENNFYGYLTEMGVAFSMGLSGFVASIAASFPAQQACRAIARQPFFGQKIQNIMILTQSLMQAPIFFSLVITFLIRYQAETVSSFSESIRLIASGLSIGLGSIGPSIGLAVFSAAACNAVGINRDAYKKILSFTLFSEALVESSLIFALIIALILLRTSSNPLEPTISAISFLASAFTIGLGTLGTGINSGRVASSACKMIALNPEQYSALFRTSLFAQAFIETITIYALLVALWLAI